MDDFETIKILLSTLGYPLFEGVNKKVPNEGWDSPKTEVLFMARPTLSQTLYIQQLGRGMRKSEGKEYLMVFDFIERGKAIGLSGLSD